MIGPIDDASDAGRGWRKTSSEFLWSLGAGVFDPTNKPMNLLDEDENFVNEIRELKQLGRYDEVRIKMKKVVTADLSMLDRSDFCICYLNNDVQMTGTIGELHYAALEKKPTIVVCEQGKHNIPNWLFGIGLSHEHFFGSFKTAEQFITRIHLGTEDLSDDWKFIDYDKVFNNR